MLSRILRDVVTRCKDPALKRPACKIVDPTSGRTSYDARSVHTSEIRDKDDEDKPSSIVLHAFANVERKEKEAYLEIIRQYKKGNDLRRGHVEFIKVALKYMDEFGVNRDLAVYKSLLDVFPKGKFVPRNGFQTIFMHYPKQQYVAVELLTKMETNTVMPDVEMQTMLLNIFGKHGDPLKKFWRIAYWMPKFANLNPWPCPRPAPKDPRELARLAMRKISSVDVQTKITEFETKDMRDAVEDTWIVSAMSCSQEELLQKQPLSDPIFVEGPYTIWVADKCIDYFLLRGEMRKKWEYEDTDDVSNIKIPFWDKKEIIPFPTVHEQDDGVYFAMCATGTSTKDSLLSWIRFLEKQNPVLSVIPIVFRMTSISEEQLYIETEKSENKVSHTID